MPNVDYLLLAVKDPQRSAKLYDQILGVAPVRARRSSKSLTWIGFVHLTLVLITAVGCAPRRIGITWHWRR